MRAKEKKWTKTELKYLKLWYGTSYNNDLIKRFKVNINQIYAIANKLGLKKQYSTKFKKGRTPHNKGKKANWKTIEAIQRYQYKKGNTPHNISPIGTISKINSRYNFIKLKNGKWKALHRYIYEKHYGNIKKNEMVIFIDGNVENTSIKNLKKITLAQNLRRNAKTKNKLQRAI